MKNIAVITARSGSKGLPDKNIKPLCGKPLMAYSIEAALKSGMFDVVHVSTDSEKYAEIARQYGAKVPFARSAETSSDTASSWDAVREVLEKYHATGKDFDTFMLLQPTSPLRTEDDIRKAYQLMDEKKANAIVSVCEAEHPPVWYNTLPPNGAMDGFIREELSSGRRQDTGTYYRINGAIYLSDVFYFLQDKNIYRAKCFSYIMEKGKSVDIDEIADFMLAECLLKLK